MGIKCDIIHVEAYMRKSTILAFLAIFPIFSLVCLAQESEAEREAALERKLRGQPSKAEKNQPANTQETVLSPRDRQVKELAKDLESKAKAKKAEKEKKKKLTKYEKQALGKIESAENRQRKTEETRREFYNLADVKGCPMELMTIYGNAVENPSFLKRTITLVHSVMTVYNDKPFPVTIRLNGIVAVEGFCSGASMVLTKAANLSESGITTVAYTAEGKDLDGNLWVSPSSPQTNLYACQGYPCMIKYVLPAWHLQ